MSWVLFAAVLPANATLHIMPLGDSITEGWAFPASIPGGYRLPLYQALTNGGYNNLDFVGTLTVNPATGLPYPHHEGHGGYKVGDIKTNILSWLSQITDQPDIILLDIGTNDFGTDGTDSGNVTNQLDGLISLLATNRSNAKIIVCNLTLKTGGYSTANTNIQTKYNPFIPGIVAKHAALGHKVYFLDMYSALGASDLADGVHPNQTGYNKMGARWYSRLSQVLDGITPLAQPRLSIKFAADQNQGADAINNNYGAGVLNTTNWFNLFGVNGASNGVSPVTFYTDNGVLTASGAMLVYNYSAKRNLTDTAGGALTNNVALQNSYIVPADNGWYLSVTNLDAAFTNGYSVYFYYRGSSAGYGGQNYLRYYAGATTTTTLLGNRQWNLFTTDASNNGTFIQDLNPANTSTSGETTGANFFVFTNLSGGAFDLLITNGNNGGVSAIEIVANTLPSVGRMVVTPGTNIYAGTTASLTCPTNGGQAPFSMSWQGCADGINWTNVPGATTTNLTLANFAVGNAGYYQMIYAAGSFSATSTVVKLTYYSTLPTISAATASPGNIVNQGTTVNLSCTTNGGAPPFTVQWQASANGINYTNVSGGSGLPLSIAAIGLGDAGFYQCIFTAANLSVTSAPVQLTVQPLAISPAAVLPSRLVLVGQSAVVICTNFSGLGAFNFRWQAGPNGVTWTNVPGALTNSLVLLGVTTNNAGYYQCVLTAANGSVTSAPVQLGVMLAGGPAAKLAIKFAPDQSYNHSFINLNWTTPATKQPAGVLNTTNWNNWNVTGSSPYSWNAMFYDVNGKTNGNKSTATIIDYHTQGEQVVYGGTSGWANSWFTNNNALLLNSTFWYGADQLACQVTNLDLLFAANGYSIYIYFLNPNIGCGQQYCLANYAGTTLSGTAAGNQVCSLYTTTNWNSFNSGAYLTNLPSYLKGTAIFTQGVQTTSTTHGAYPTWENAGADYIVFSNCPPGGAFSISVSNTYYAGICGIEIVQNVAGAGGLLSTVATLAASTNSVPPGGLVSFTNTVSPASPDGEYVVFMDGTTVLGLGTLSGGKAVYSSASLAGGSHNITAVYVGDKNYLASTSSVATVTVVANPTLSAPVALPSADVYTGMNVVLVCSNYTGTPPFSFQWQAGGDGVLYTNVTDALTNQMTLTGVTTNNSGYYRLAFTASSLSVTSAVVQLTVNPPATMNVLQTDGNLVLTWPQGVLLQATNLTGPWTTNNVTSPFTNQPGNPQMFYRVLVQ